jgi:HEXXH motif-containing protein
VRCASSETDARERSYPRDRHRPIVEAAQALLSAWPEEYEDWRCMMRVVVPRLPPRGWQMEGFTISSMQGAAWINPSDTLRALESLVHEHSHVKLRYVEEAVPLLQPEQTGDALSGRLAHRSTAPWSVSSRGCMCTCTASSRWFACWRGAALTSRHAAATPPPAWTNCGSQAREGIALSARRMRSFTAAGQGFSALGRVRAAPRLINPRQRMPQAARRSAGGFGRA